MSLCSGTSSQELSVNGQSHQSTTQTTKLYKAMLPSSKANAADREFSDHGEGGYDNKIKIKTVMRRTDVALDCRVYQSSSVDGMEAGHPINSRSKSKDLFNPNASTKIMSLTGGINGMHIIACLLMI